jgi:HlyD family secretion protein
MKRAMVIALVALVVALLAGTAWWLAEGNDTTNQLVLYGNVDLRQVDLAFNNSQRIAEVLVEEGDRVKRGQVVARLDKNRLDPQVAEAEAQVAAQRQVVRRLRSGTRPEEIEQARANLQSAEADAANARRLYDRLETISAESDGGAVSRQDIDNAEAALAVASAKVEVNRNALQLAVAGPRAEDIAEAEARLRASEAQLDYLRQELADAQLMAPMDAVVRTRVMEPGEIASPQKPVLLLAILDPKWVRAYVSEPDLGKVREGVTASISVDSFPDQRFKGWVGFISPVAEFTPKAVQTDELRTSLVYEIRVFVEDPENQLRLGMPATVTVSLDQTESRTDASPSTAEAGRDAPAESQQ